MKIVKLNNEDYLKCSNFANDSYSFHQSNNRKKDKVIDDILRGKLGEIAFYKLFEPKLLQPPSFEIRTGPDPGWDLITSKNKKIDVKTIYPNGRYVTFNKNRMYADFYAIMELNLPNMECKLFDIKSKTYMINNAKNSNFNNHYIVINRR